MSSPVAKFAYVCPACDKPLSLPSKLFGRRIRCPKCKEVFRFGVKGRPAELPTPSEAKLVGVDSRDGSKVQPRRWSRVAQVAVVSLALGGVALALAFRAPQTTPQSNEPMAAKLRDKVVDKAVDRAIDKGIDKTEEQLKKALARITELERRQAEPAPRYEPPRQPDPEPVRRDPEPEPKREPEKLAADIVVGYVSVQSTKEDGADWDIGGGYPEIKVYVGHDYLLAGTSAWTSVKDDTLSATFNEKTIRVKEGERIKIQVWDQDVLDDDLIGEYVKEITAETIRQGSVTWTMGQATVTIKFEL